MRTGTTRQHVGESSAHPERLDAPSTEPAPSGHRRWSLREILLVALTLVAATAIYMLRRPDEFLAHYVWAEEGLILHRSVEDGWSAAVMPVQGQFYLLTTTCIVAAAKISWLLLPAIDYFAAVGVFVITSLLLLVPRSSLGPVWLRAAMVLALAAVPANPEVYDVMLYSFWWTSLWPLIAYAWKDANPWFRRVVLGLAGLNSLAAAAMCVLYAFGGVVDRSRRLLVDAAILAATLVVQGFAWAYSPRREALDLRPVATLKQTFVNFFEFAVQPILGARTVPDDVRTLIGLALVVAALIACRGLADRGEQVLGYSLTLAAVILSGLSAIPAPFIAHPILAGPRYFFLPFAAASLLLLFLVSRARQRAVTVAATLCLAWSLARLPDAFARHSDHLSWRDATIRCANAHRDTYKVPIQYDGLAADAWRTWAFPRHVCVDALH